MSGTNKGFSAKFTETIGKISGNSFLLTLRDSFVLVSVPTMIAGFAIMINSVFLDPAGGLIFSKSGLHLGQLISGSEEQWLESGLAHGLSKVQSIINLISQGTLNVVALMLVMIFAFVLSRNYFKQNREHLISVLYAVAAFFICLPWNWNYGSGDGTVVLSNVVNPTFFGTQGIFSALIIGGAAVFLYNKLLNTNFKIKLPKSVPPMVASSFESLIPGTLTLLFFALLTGISSGISGLTLPELFLSLLQKPAEFIAGTAAFAFISQFTWLLFFWFGIHPSSIWGAIFGMTWNINDVQNMAGEAQHLYSTIFMNFSTIGAGTVALAPVLALLIASRSDVSKQVSKIAFMPALFNISEPIVFGLPLVLNPVYFIPMVLSQPICFFIAVFFTKIGFIDVISLNAPWTVPPIISGILFTGSIKGAIVQAVCLAVATALYIPFVRMADRLEKQKLEGKKK
ncbi:MAG: PTS transporter subunit EIIC [Hungatella sp.]|jgi:PTS system cellobiose-specific IIC component|nr:PTS transporter subunit EIIC [Hungatella sp.]